jgi:CCR4-NOT transcriptional regulation complex NOT5 subunit
VQHPSYEEGDYIYFDYQLDREDAWVFRLKRGYRLPYDMLEQSLLPQ